jgi:hypothetical protein
MPPQKSEEKPAAEATEEKLEASSQEEQKPAADDEKKSEPTPDEFDADKAKAKISKVNSEAANLRKRLKELEPMASKAKELEEAQKSESQRLTEAKTVAEKEAVKASQEAARLRVALKKGLTEIQAKRLIGETEEELEADADELLESFKPKDDPDKKSPEDEKSEPPKGGERSGATGDTKPEETDPRKLAEGLPSYS